MYWEVWVLFSEVQLLCLNSGLGINLPGKVPRSAVWDPEWFWPMAGRQKDSHTSHSAYRVPTSAPKGRVDQWGTWPVKCDVEVGIPFPLPVMWPWTRYLKSQSSVSSLTKENKNWCFLKGLLWRVHEAVCIKLPRPWRFSMNISELLLSIKDVAWMRRHDPFLPAYMKPASSPDPCGYARLSLGF